MAVSRWKYVIWKSSKSYLFSTQNELGDEIIQGTTFTPAIEPKHPGAFLTETQYEALEKGNMNRVPLLIGTTSEEMIWWKGSSKF